MLSPGDRSASRTVASEHNTGIEKSAYLLLPKLDDSRCATQIAAVKVPTVSALCAIMLQIPALSVARTAATLDFTMARACF